MKRSIVLILTVLCVLLSPICLDNVHAETYTGSCGDNVTYTFDPTTGTLSISGTGKMMNYFSATNVPWYEYRESIKEVTISSGITSIGNDAFYGCTGLTSIVIPDSVTSIGDVAFAECSGLTSIDLGNGVTSIGYFSFTLCTGLTSITIPSTVMTIGFGAFNGCAGLTSIYIPRSVMYIFDWAFAYCDALSSITVDPFNFMYDSRDNCNAIIQTSTNKLIAGCKDTVIPSSVTSIGSTAFCGIKTLTSIEIPDSITSIGMSAFEYTGLTSITIPSSVTSIGNSAFQNIPLVKYYCDNTIISETNNFGALAVEEIHYITTGEITAEPTCSSEGIITGVCSKCGETHSQSIPADPNSHKYGQPKWTWSSDYSSATATFTCEYNGEHKEIVRGIVKTTENEAENIHTATAKFNGSTYTDTKIEPKDFSKFVPEIALSAQSTDGITLAWNNHSSATAYELYRKTGTGSWKKVATTSELEILDAVGRTMGTKYTYRVRGYDGSKYSKYSNEIELTYAPFEDVPTDHVHFTYVSWAFNKAIINGTSTTTFSPADGCTRGQFCLMLWRMLGSAKTTGTSKFTDIADQTANTQKAIIWAESKGIVNGYPDGTFRPNEYVTRAQMAIMLWRVAGKPKVTGTSEFTDISECTPTTQKAIIWMAQKGISKGYVEEDGSKTFHPNADCTRSELTVFLYRMNNLNLSKITNKASVKVNRDANYFDIAVFKDIVKD